MEKDFFKVVEEGLVTNSGKVVSGRKAIVREDTGQVLGVVSDRYALVRHEELMRAVSEVANDSNLTCTDVVFCKGGAVMFSNFSLPVETGEKEIRVGDILRFGVEVFNSYDGSMKIGAVLRSYRLRCSNGAVVPRTMTEFAVKHLGELELGEIKRKIGDILGQVEMVVKQWRVWANTPVAEGQVRQFFANTVGKRLRDEMYRKYETTKMADTVWDVFNAMTYHISHDMKVRKGNEENKRLLQFGAESLVGDQVEKWTESLAKGRWDGGVGMVVDNG